MKKTFLVICCLLFLTSIIKAQDNSMPTTKEIQVKDGNLSTSGSFFVSEIHGFAELNSFKISLIGYLLQTGHIRHVILEMGNSAAYLINRYQQKGDDNSITNPKVRQLYEQYRKLYQQHPFTIHGIDFERMEFVKAAKYILTDNVGAEKSELYKYINSITDTAGKIPTDAKGYEARTYYYNQSCVLFLQEKERLRAVVKTDFDVLEHIFENPASEQHMARRNKSMYTNLAALSTQMQEGFMCILGGSHNMLNGSGSLLSRYLSDHHDSIILIKMLCKNCYTSGYFKANTLTPFAQDPDDTKVQTETLAAGFDSYYDNNSYLLVNERDLLKEQPEHKKPVSVYYALFKDQPQW